MDRASLQKVKDEINTRTIKRYDPDIRKLLLATSYVRIFTYDINLFDWVRHEIDGVFYIYLSNGGYTAKILILSRVGFDFLVIPFTFNTEMLLIKSFAIIRSDDVIYGIWFPHSEEYEKSGNVLRKMIPKTFSFAEYMNKQKNDSFDENLEINHSNLIGNPRTRLDLRCQNQYLDDKHYVANIEMQQMQELKKQNLTHTSPQIDSILSVNRNITVSPELKGEYTLNSNGDIMCTPVADNATFLNLTYENSPYSVQNIEMQQKLNAQKNTLISPDGNKLNSKNDSLHPYIAKLFEHIQSENLNPKYENCPYSLQNIEMQQKLKTPQFKSLNKTNSMVSQSENKSDKETNRYEENFTATSLGNCRAVKSKKKYNAKKNVTKPNNECTPFAGNMFQFIYENSPYSLEKIEMQQKLMLAHANSIMRNQDQNCADVKNEPNSSQIISIEETLRRLKL